MGIDVRTAVPKVSDFRDMRPRRSLGCTRDHACGETAAFEGDADQNENRSRDEASGITSGALMQVS